MKQIQRNKCFKHYIVITKVITNKINNLTSLVNEQQVFMDRVFVIIQVTEKSIEQNRSAYMCCIDSEKALNSEQLRRLQKVISSEQNENHKKYISKKL